MAVGTIAHRARLVAQSAGLLSSGHRLAASRKALTQATLLQRAVTLGAITTHEVSLLDAGRQIRSRLAHPEGPVSYSLGIAFPILRGCHLAVDQVAQWLCRAS